MAAELSLTESFRILREFAMELSDMEFYPDSEAPDAINLKHAADHLHVMTGVAASALRRADEVRSVLSLNEALSHIQELDNAYDVYCQMMNGPASNVEEDLYDIIQNSVGHLSNILDHGIIVNGRIFTGVEPAPALPDNKPAPIQVTVEDNVLRLISTHNRSGLIDYPSANRVREALRNNLQGLVEDLPSSSNVDRGYVRACERLLEYLSIPIEDQAIEALGLQYQLVEKITRRVAEELGATMLDEIEHVLTGVGVLLNQFDEWRRYLEELAKTRLDPEDGAGLVIQSKALIAELEKPGAPVEPALVERLRAMIEPALTGIVGADTIAIPLVCSLSNIFSSLSQHAIDYYQTVPADHQHAVAASAVALLAKYAVDLIEKFCPVLSQYQPLTFIIGVARYLLPLYAMIKDVTS